MFQAIPVVEDNIFAFKATGKLTEEDYAKFLPELEKLIKENGKISLFVELEDFRGWEPKAAWEDMKFGEEHDDDFKRIAIVGDKPWMKWMVAIGNAFTDTEIRYFDRDHSQQAWDWLREADDAAPESAENPAKPVEAVQPYQHIVAAVDFTPYSRRAVNRAVELARQYNAKLSLVHAVQHVTYPGLDYDLVMVDPGEFLEVDQQIFKASEERLEKMAKSLDLPDVTQEVLWGAPKATVLSFAEAQNADLIVAGSHGHHGLARLIGSTANGIAHGARCDVMIVKSPQ